MEEEEEEHVPSFRRYKEWLDTTTSSCSPCHQSHVMSFHESSFATSFVDYVNSILEKCNVKWKSKSHP